MHSPTLVLFMAGFCLIHRCRFVLASSFTNLGCRAREVLEQQGTDTGLVQPNQFSDTAVMDQPHNMVFAQGEQAASTVQVPSIHDAHRSAFEKSMKNQECQKSFISNVSGNDSMGLVSNVRAQGSGNGTGFSANGMTPCPSDMQPVNTGVQRPAGSKISPSPSWVEQRDNGSGEPCGPQLTRVETFSEVRKRFEEAHAAGLLHESTAC